MNRKTDDATALADNAAPTSIANDDELLDDPAVAHLLGDIDLSTLWRMRRLGQFPSAIKVGRLNRTRRGTLRQWLQTQEREAAARQKTNASTAA